MKKNLKILYIAPTSSIFAGDTISLGHLLQGLKYFGVETFVVTSSLKSSSLFQNIGAQCKVLEQPVFKMTAIKCPINSIKNLIFYPYFYLRDLARMYKTFKAIENVVLEYQPDIIHSNTGAVFAGHFISKKYKIPHIWHVREFLDLDFKVKLLVSRKMHLKMLSFKNNHIVFITECIKRHYNGLENSKVIYNGILPVLQTRFEIKKSNYFLFVGKITEGKGVNVLLKSFVEFYKKYSTYKLLIVGEPLDQSYKKKMEYFVNKSGLAGIITFLGNRNDVHELMAKATALIVPSVSEAFGRVTVEAMFNGCLVIGNKTAGTREIMEKDTVGLLYSGIHELENQMEEVAKNGIECYFPIIKKAQDIAKEMYSQEKNARSMYTYYKLILNNK